LRKKRVLASSWLCLLSVRPSVRPSIRPRGTTRFPVDEFLRNLIFEPFSKICSENLSLIQNRQE
jgi:hypothetical protein